MPDLLEKARVAKRESKQVEFKSSFDPSSDGQWCEILKDIAAIANSGGGIIVFGVSNDGGLSMDSCVAVSQIDHANLTNKVFKYTGCSDPQVEIVDIVRDGVLLPAFLVQGVSPPWVFGKPGTYVGADGKPKSAFAQGTVYFRHGAKSEPGTGDDLRFAFDRQLGAIREGWLKRVRRVVKAPAGAEIVIRNTDGVGGIAKSGNVRAVNDPNATQVVLTRDANKATGVFLHEEISDGIFDEINNVIDASRILVKGRSRFSLGPDVYYRVYAERRYVKQDSSQLAMLFRAGACDFYAPSLYWATQLDVAPIAQVLSSIYLAPKGLQMQWFLRTAALLGSEFCEWVNASWDKRWHGHSQPPSFYFSFQNMLKELKIHDRIIVAARSSPTEKFSMSGGSNVSALDLLGDRATANLLLSSSCMKVFGGNSELRAIARSLDYFAHGAELELKAKEIAQAVISSVGDRPPGDFGNSEEPN